MIDFACKRFDLQEVIKCSLGLTRAEYKVFQHVLEHPEEELSTEELAKSLKLDLSTIQKAVKKLYEKSVVERYQVNLDSGGYVFMYKTKSKNVVREAVKSVIRSWSKQVEEHVDSW